MTNASNRFKKIIAGNWCFVGIIVFFVLHGYVQFIQEVAFPDLMLLFIKLLAEALVLYFISRWLLGSSRKANLFTTLIFIIALYFGVYQDFLGQFRFLADVSKFGYFTILTFLVIGILFFWIKRTSRSLNRPVVFLNTLLLIYIFIDSGRLMAHKVTPVVRSSNHLSNLHVKPCDSCNKPSVYLILLDMYWGSTAMKEYYNYDNSGFDNFLRDQGFYLVTASHSNYLFTYYSMASLLSMQFLEGIGEPYYSNHYAYVKAARTLKFNPVVAYFKSMGYDIHNLSYFEMEGVPAQYNSDALPAKVQLVLTHTLYYRINKHLQVYLRKKKIRFNSAEREETILIKDQEALMQRTLAISQVATEKPVFTYVHLHMPHEPFLLDSNGRYTQYLERASKLTPRDMDSLFLNYEVYTNKRMTTFISDLKKATGNKAVILLMSDHGYYHARAKDFKLLFSNLNAVYIPGNRYAAWYKGMSNVNQFRVLFNTLYHQELPLLPDSIVTK